MLGPSISHPVWRKRIEESDEAIVAGKRGNARGCEGPLRVKGTMQIKWREQ